ncbi:protein of unknown function [Butyrivibrio hungatei DSM 14810]|uniref:Uncharacterized protein n=1 Tax=Butyrivibrio hungatei DSM 14810 TaxID=1121132 RepID=A0A1M7RQU0_9FIRM|nr:DUF4357 domain-containing protein [Butyrivibrio hungatei]SHN48428.1 protein of unknown function [Butyrivibrio hungatei DSM 14810]
MLKLFIWGRTHRTNATAKYDVNTGEVKVLKGTVVSEDVKDFTHKEEIKALRLAVTNESGELLKDVEFSNPTAAAQFVCGYSVSGPIAWHVEKHKNLANWLKENK